MKTKLAKILDECIERIKAGESVDAVLAQRTRVREQLEPLLNAAHDVYVAPRVAPSDTFLRTLEQRLTEQYREKHATHETSVSVSKLWTARLSLAWQNLLGTVVGARRAAIPVMLALLLIIGASFGAFKFLSPSTALASQCTLSILSGKTEVQKAGTDSWYEGNDGMTLAAGARIRTLPDSHALLTFFEGSTIKLEANTDIEIRQLETNEQQAVNIVVKQWVGKTWSRVVKMVDPGSHYEIETPSAIAVVRGTLFTTDVNETGATKVATTEGLVSVIAQGEEVYLPGKQQTQIETGTVPSQPTVTPNPKAELLIHTDAPAVCSVVDPTGASTGYLPSGLSFNQIPGSQSSFPADGPQVITIPQPISGEYIVAFRYITEGTANFNIQGKSDGELAFQYGGSYGALNKNGWIVRVNLHVENGLIIGSEINGVTPLGDEIPEKIVSVKSVKDIFEPDKTPTSDKGRSEDNGKNEDKGKSQDKGRSKDNNKNEDKGKKENHNQNAANNQDKNNGKDKER